MLPLLLTPKIRQIRNRWKFSTDSSALYRDLFIAFIAILIILAIFGGTHRSLQKVSELVQFFYLPPSTPFSVILLFLMVTLLLSNLALIMGSFFLSEELELLLSSPVSSWKLFSGKTTYLLILSSSIPLVFIYPFLAAFGRFYDAGLFFYILSPLALLPFFLIINQAALLACTAFFTFIPPTRIKHVLLAILLFLAIAVIRVLSTYQLSPDTALNLGHIIKTINTISMPEILWLPSRWCARLLEYLLIPEGPFPGAELTLLVSCSIFVSAASWLLLDLFHSSTYSEIQSEGKSLSPGSLIFPPQSKRAISEAPASTMKTLIGKEFKLLIRDFSQATQILLLISLCILYLFNLQIFSGLLETPDRVGRSWHYIFLIINICLATFIGTAICTRLVFPSISLEGKSFWILNSSPVSFSKMLEAKFNFWFLPVSLITSTFFALGTWVIGGSVETILISILSSFLINYGVVALAVGLGARFARFDWEFSTELIASLGSIIFMLCSIFLILLSLFPAALAVLSVQFTVFDSNETERLLMCSGSLIALLYMQIKVKQSVMNTGLKNLVRLNE